jgi:hypothetical protein
MTTNGTTPETKPEATASVLEKLHTEFEKTYKGKTSKARTKELVTAFAAATAARAKAESAVETATQAETAAAAAIIREVSGKNKVTIGGNLYSPMSRGARVFFRRESGETLDLG